MAVNKSQVFSALPVFLCIILFISSVSADSWQAPAIPKPSSLYDPAAFPEFSSLLHSSTVAAVPSSWTRQTSPTFYSTLAAIKAPWAPTAIPVPVYGIPIVQAIPKVRFPPDVWRSDLAPMIPPTPTVTTSPAPVRAPAEPPVPHVPVSTNSLYISGLSVTDGSVQIMNGGPSQVDLTGWRIGNGVESINFIKWPLGNGKYFTFTLQPHMTFSVHTGIRGAVTATDLYWPFEHLWSQSGEHAAYLYDSYGTLVSSLEG